MIKALTDFRLATEEFRSFVRTLETVESLRIQPFAVDGEQRAYYDFGFKDGRICMYLIFAFDSSMCFAL